MSRSVLVVDDEPMNLTLMKALLEPLRVEVRTARGGREAIAEITRAEPDLVLLDLHMPELDGIDVLMHVRAAHGAHLPVIVVTADGERVQRVRALEVGADDYLEKPIDLAILKARVRTLLALKASRDDLAAEHVRLLALQREQREMMEFIVHDLRTPLGVVMANVEYAGASMETDPIEAMVALRDASDSIVRVSDLVNDMLAVARLEQSGQALRAERIDLDDLIARVRDVYVRKARAQGVRLLSSAAHVAVRGDESLLRRVLENLLDNSLRHTPPEGSVGLEVTLSRSGASIAISNTGPAIPTEDREAIFEKFVRGRAKDSRPGAVGLGLYFCKRVVEAHGGGIHVEGTDRWPTRFVIDLPSAA